MLQRHRCSVVALVIRQVVLPLAVHPPLTPRRLASPARRRGRLILRDRRSARAHAGRSALLVESARSSNRHIQLAAIRALGRLERRDVITELLPYLRRRVSAAAATKRRQAIGQAMRGERCQLDPKDEQIEGVSRR